MSHISVIRNLDNRQSKLRAPPYHIRYHKNEKMSQLFEKGFIFPRSILPSGVRKKIKKSSIFVIEPQFTKGCFNLASTYEAWRVTTP